MADPLSSKCKPLYQSYLFRRPQAQGKVVPHLAWQHCGSHSPHTRTPPRARHSRPPHIPRAFDGGSDMWNLFRDVHIISQEKEFRVVLSYQTMNTLACILSKPEVYRCTTCSRTTLGKISLSQNFGVLPVKLSSDLIAKCTGLPFYWFGVRFPVGAGCV